jgi:hypothetical protein
MSSVTIPQRPNSHWYHDGDDDHVKGAFRKIATNERSEDHQQRSQQTVQNAKNGRRNSKSIPKLVHKQAVPILSTVSQ